MKQVRGLLHLAALLWLLAPSVAVAQEYPNRAIKIVVGFPPGGGVDTVARVIGAEMSKGLGQSMVVENKPGAAGTLGAAEVARSTPDGYTLLVTPGGHSIFGAMFKSLPFHTVDGFDWISHVIKVPFLVMAPAASEFRSLAEVIAKAKAAPGTVTFGSAGPGSTHHLGMELLARTAGVKLLHVPYRGDAPLVTALLAGEVQFALATPTLVLQNVQAGKLRPLAVTTHARWRSLPEIPTVEQAIDVQAFDVRTWFGMAGPAGMPKPIVERLNSELRKAVTAPEVRDRLAGIGGEVAPSAPAEMRDSVARELAIWTRIVEEAGIAKQ